MYVKCHGQTYVSQIRTQISMIKTVASYYLLKAVEYFIDICQK